MKWILLILVLTEAIYEGLYDRGWKWLSKVCQFLFIATFFYFAYKCSEGWQNKYIIIYLLFRMSMFNYINALASGRKTLLGTTSLIDRVVRILTLGSLWMYILVTLICLIFALWL